MADVHAYTTEVEQLVNSEDQVVLVDACKPQYIIMISQKKQMKIETNSSAVYQYWLLLGYFQEHSIFHKGPPKFYNGTKHKIQMKMKAPKAKQYYTTSI